MSQEFVVANVWLLGVFVADSLAYRALCLVMAVTFFSTAMTK